MVEPLITPEIWALATCSKIMGPRIPPSVRSAPFPTSMVGTGESWAPPANKTFVEDTAPDATTRRTLFTTARDSRHFHRERNAQGSEGEDLWVLSPALDAIRGRARLDHVRAAKSTIARDILPRDGPQALKTSRGVAPSIGAQAGSPTRDAQQSAYQAARDARVSITRTNSSAKKVVACMAHTKP